MEPYLSSASGAVSAAIIDQLAKTRGWTMFVSVMLWLGAGFLLLAGIALLAMGMIGSAAGGETFGEMSNSMGGAIGMVAIGVLYLVFAVVYIFPALKLSKFSSRCSELKNAQTEIMLVAALNEMRAFWKFVGIWLIILIALYPIIIVGAVAFGLFSATAM
jgi:hypothetical protein